MNEPMKPPVTSALENLDTQQKWLNPKRITLSLLGIVALIALLGILYTTFSHTSDERVTDAKNLDILATYTEAFIKHIAETKREFLISHYQFNDNAVQYFTKCSLYSDEWCPSNLIDIKPEKFTPLNKDIARAEISKEGEATRLLILQNGEKVSTSLIANPLALVAIGELETNPIYFSDGRQIYHMSAPPFSNDRTEAAKYFPLEIPPNADVRIPTEYSRVYDIKNCSITGLHSDILFVDDHVYANGELIPGADAYTFEAIPYETDSPIAGPWFRDAHHVYYDGQLVLGADPETLYFPEGSYNPIRNKEMIVCPEHNTPLLAADKDSVFFASETNLSCRTNDCTLELRIPNVTSAGLKVSEYINENGRTFIPNKGSVKQIIETDAGFFYLDGKEHVPAEQQPELKNINSTATVIAPGTKGMFIFTFSITSPDNYAIDIDATDAAILSFSAGEYSKGPLGDDLVTLTPTSPFIAKEQGDKSYYQIPPGQKVEFTLEATIDFSDFYGGEYTGELIQVKYTSKSFEGVRKLSSDNHVVSPVIEISGPKKTTRESI